MSPDPEGGGPEVATNTLGEFVPNVEGTYDQASVAAACANEFDTTIEVAQAQKNFILQTSNAGFSDYNGTVDEEGVLTPIWGHSRGYIIAPPHNFSKKSLQGRTRMFPIFLGRLSRDTMILFFVVYSSENAWSPLQ